LARVWKAAGMKVVTHKRSQDPKRTWFITVAELGQKLWAGQIRRNKKEIILKHALHYKKIMLSYLQN
jgi:hypothetical protein